MVKNILHALLSLAEFHLSNKNTVTIAVTGSTGKTTTKEMIKSVLSVKYKTLSTFENENNEIGVSKTALSVKDEQFCVIEMGMRGSGEIRALSGACHPHTSVITNCGSAHIGLLGSLENIFLAKAEVLEYTEKYCILPFEERFVNLKKADLIATYIGADDVNSDLCAENVVMGKKGITYSIKYKGCNKGEIYIPTFSLYNVKNSLNAYAVGLIYGMEHGEIQKGLSEFSNISLREDKVTINGIFIFLECYNASFNSMKSAIYSFVEYCKIKKLTPNILLGKMQELGDNEEEYHYRIGEYARDIGVKELIAIGKESKPYLDGFYGGLLFDNKKDAAKYVLENYGSSDAFLIKGSRTEKLEYIVNEMEELTK